MYLTSGSINPRSGVPIRYSFTLNGDDFSVLGVGADKLVYLSPSSCQAEPLDGKFDVNEISCSFIDTNAALWRIFGKGSLHLSSSFAATIAVGGTMDYATYLPKDSSGNPMLRNKVSGTGQETYVVHTGRIYEVSRKDRITTIVSRNNMARVADMEWRFPVHNTVKTPARYFGTNVFFTENLVDTLPEAVFDLDEGAFQTYAYVGTQNQPSLYATLPGRGQLGLCGSQGFVFPGTAFYFAANRFLFRGTWLGSYQGFLVGTETSGSAWENDLKKANTFGFNNIDEARAAVIVNARGTFTVINKLRLTPSGDGPNYTNGTSFSFQQGKFTLEENPARLWYELLTGHSVTPYFNGTDIDSDSYGSAVKITAYQRHKRDIDPKGGKVLPFLKELIEPLQARFSVGQANTLRLHLFGPRTLTETLQGTITQDEVLTSESFANAEDYVNRIILRYGYDTDTGSYTRQQEIRGTSWSNNNDYLKEIEAPWVFGDNDARISAQRILRRFGNGVPRVKTTLPLNKASLDVGTLVMFNDADLDISNTPFEIMSWSKSFGEEKSVTIEMINAEAAYQRRGYARWEDAGTLTNTVTGTSTSGWGTSGTVAGINTAIYGPRWVWW